MTTTFRTSAQPAADGSRATQTDDALLAMPLEPRLLLDAAAVATVADTVEDGGDASKAAYSEAVSSEESGGTAEDTVAAEALAAGAGEIVFIDTGVEGWEDLADSVDPSADVVLVGPDEDGIQVMADTLAGRSDVQSVHVLGHGDVGSFQLGSATVDSETLSQYTDAFATIGGALAPTGDLLLYGCYVGASGEGTAFIDALAETTGADVAASTDLTGAANLDGDWTLEAQTGDIAASAVTPTLATAGFAGILAPGDTVDFSGATGGGTNTVTDEGFSFVTSSGTFFTGLNEGDIDGASGSFTVTMTSTSAGQQFTLDQLDLFDGGSGLTLNVEGFISGVSQATQTGIDVADNSFSTGSTLTLANFDNVNVDEVVFSFTGSGGVDAIFDDVATGVAITNAAPTASGVPTDVSVTEDTASNFDLSAVTFADSDDSSLTVTIAASSGTFTTVADGAAIGAGVTESGQGTNTVTLSGSIADINSYLDVKTNLQYTGATNASGDNAATFTINADDGTVNPQVGSGNIDITAVNDAPTAAGVPTDVTVTEDQESDFDLSSVALGDVDGDTLTVTISASAGTFTTVADGSGVGAGVTENGQGTGTVTLVGSATDINTYLDTTANLRYTGPTNVNGDNAATFTINADDGTVNPQVGSGNIDITAVNDAPTASGVPTDVSVTEDQESDFDLSGTSFTDVDGDTLTVTITASAGTFTTVANGAGVGAGVSEGGQGTNSVTLQGSAGDIATYLGTASNLRYTGATNASGDNAATFTIDANDGTVNPQVANGNIDITAVNDAPSLTTATVNVGTTDEDTASAGQTVSTLLGNFTSNDVDGDTLGIAVTGGSAANGTWQYDSGGGWTTFDVGTLSDGAALLLAPTTEVRFNPDGTVGGTQSLLFRAWDQSGGSAGATVDTSGAGTGTSPFSGNSATAEFTVTDVNDAPTLGGTPADETVIEDVATAIDLSAYNLGDVDDGSLTLTLAVDRGSIATVDGNGTFGGVTIAGSGTASMTLDGSLANLNAYLNDSSHITYTTGNNDTAAATLTVTPNDGTVDGTADTVTINVTPVNDAPTATGTISSTALNDNAGAQTIFGGIVIGDVDAGETDLTVEIRLSNPSAGSISGGGFTDEGSGVYRLTGQTPASATTALDSAAFTPANDTGPSGTFSTDFTIAVDDQSASEVTLNAGTMTVTRVNDAPTITNVAGESTNITAGDGPQDVLLLNDAAIADPDAANFDGGQLNITQATGTTNGQWQLDNSVAISSGGTLPADVIFASGDTVSVDTGGGFVAIGTVNASNTGIAPDPLVIDLNGNATPARVAALLGALEYNIPSGIDTRTFGLTVSDGAGQTSAAANFTLESVPPGPEITSIASATADGLYGVGDPIDVTVTLDTASDFTAGGGTLQATLSNGATVVLASGDVTNTTTFSGTYTIAEGDGDATDITVTSVSLAGGATLVANTGGAPADLNTLPPGDNLADNENIDVDANTPNVAVPDLTAATDTGVSDTDDLTNDATPTITGTTEAGATVTVRVGGAAVGAPVTADGSGNWSFTFGAGDLSESPNAVDIIASDDAGNTSADSGDLTLTLDTTAPTANADTSGTATEGGAATNLSGLNVTGNDSGTAGTNPVTAVAGSAANVGTGVTGDNGGLFTVNADGTVTFNPNGDFDALAAGATQATAVAVTVRDAAGNTATADLSVTVTGINDAPAFSGAASLAAVAEDTAGPAGATVASLFGGLVQDPDTGSSLNGVALTGNAASAAEGTWQIQIGGTGWIDLPAVSDANALLLSGASQLRFVPAADYNGTPGALSVRAVDDTYGSAFSTAPGGALTAVTQDVTGANSGGTTAFANADTALTTTITAVNDAPTATGVPATIAATEDVPSNVDLTGLTLADGDAGANPIQLTLGVDAGTLAATSGGGVTVGGADRATLTLTGSVANLNAFLADASAVQYTSAPNANGTGAATLTLTLNDQGNTGTGGGGDVALGTAGIDIAAVNDAPTVASAPADQTATADEAFSYQLPAGTFADVDQGDTLTLTAGLAAGGALPGWLTFDAATRTFSGTPGDGDAGTLSLAVTAEDGAGASATATFDLTVEAAETAPPPSDDDADDATPTVTTLDRGPVRVTIIDVGGETVQIAQSGVVSGAALQAILGTFDRGNSPLAQTFREAVARSSDAPSETLEDAVGDRATRQALQEIEDAGGETLIYQDGEWKPIDLETLLESASAAGSQGADGAAQLAQGAPASGPAGPAGPAAPTADADAPRAQRAATLAELRAATRDLWVEQAIAALAEADGLTDAGAPWAADGGSGAGAPAGPGDFAQQLRQRADAFDHDARLLAASLALVERA
jgi:hypothetical protein